MTNLAAIFTTRFLCLWSCNIHQCVCLQRRSQLPAPRKCKQILCSYRDQNEWYTILSGFFSTCCAFAVSSATLGLPAVAGHSDVSLRYSPLIPSLFPSASPSSPNVKQVDRSTMVRHLHQQNTDPFNRQPLTIEQLIPLPALRADIEAFLALHAASIRPKFSKVLYSGLA